LRVVGLVGAYDLVTRISHRDLRLRTRSSPVGLSDIAPRRAEGNALRWYDAPHGLKPGGVLRRICLARAEAPDRRPAGGGAATA
jgi:hypothetical protein